jgi:hypothetical protein
MKRPFKIVQIPSDREGWYIEDKEGLTFIGDGIKGHSLAAQICGDMLYAFKEGYNTAVKYKAKKPMTWSHFK